MGLYFLMLYDKNRVGGEDVELNIARRVSLITIALNIFLAIIKITAGILGSSSAMLADGVHTISDVGTTIIAYAGFKISKKKPDKTHPYGHEKFESIFAKILSLILLLTGIFIGYESIKILIIGNIRRPGKIALYAAVISIVFKEWMYRYTFSAAKKIRSISLEADAWHHRSDAFSSIGTLVGVLGARLGFLALDPIAGIIVSILVIKVGVELYFKSIRELVDESASEEIIKEIETITLNVNGVKGINKLRTRVSGNSIHVDMDISVNADITVKEGHDISQIVHDEIEEKLEDVKHPMIHIEPYKSK